MPFIHAIGTAVPSNQLSQQQIATFMAEVLQCDETERRKLYALYRSTRIETRHSVLADYGKSVGEFSFLPNTPTLEPFPSISARMALYRTHALPLVLEAIRNCQQQAPHLDLTQLTHVITVSCTGMYAPGLDIELIEHLGLRSDTQRTAINFMGCYGAFNGLKVADAICKAYPSSKVLLVCVELCTIHFQKKTSDDHLLANSLFADGAAVVWLESQPSEGYSLALRSFYCDLFPEGKSEMAWHVADFGFEMVLSSYVPQLVRNGIATLVNRLLEQAGVSSSEVGYYGMHPGGKAILEAIEQSMGISKHDNRFAYDVLRRYGNMSSCTVLFVLKAIFEQLSVADKGKKILSCAFGPGLTLESMLLEVVKIDKL
ncbi:MAG: type III polyketide synthase [Spirosomataceae bacterium]